MRKIFGALVVLCFSLPAFSALQTAPYAGVGNTVQTGTLTTGNQAVTVALDGSAWATAQWTVSTAGTATVTTEISLDGGTNWLASAYSKNISAVSANPSTAPWSNNGPVAGTYETPLPGNATHFRVRCGTTGTATVVSVFAGKPYTPGVPVVATLYDQTEGSIGAGVPATVLDLSGWVSVTANLTSPTTVGWVWRFLDNLGVAQIPGLTTALPAAAVITLGAAGSNQASGTIGTGTFASVATVWPRTSITLAVGGTVSVGRAIIYARR